VTVAIFPAEFEFGRTDASRGPRIARALTIAGLAAVCLLIGRPASAWVPTPNKPRLAAAARPAARYVPLHSHADPVTGHDAPAILLSGSNFDRRPVSALERGRRGTAADDWGTNADRRLRPGGCSERQMISVPSYWGATHLLI
jgi:hypothetical protein